MKYRDIISIILLILLIACSKPIVTDELDKSCESDDDCKQACPIGCINVNQHYEEPYEVYCEQIICHCIDDTCQI